MTAGGTVLRQALAAHQSGDLDRAKDLYRRVLAADPNNADAHHLMGVVAKQQGDPATAERLIRRALEINPSMAQALWKVSAMFAFCAAINARATAETSPPARRCAPIACMLICNPACWDMIIDWIKVGTLPRAR